MDSALHGVPKIQFTSNPTAPMATRLWETFMFILVNFNSEGDL